LPFEEGWVQGPYTRRTYHQREQTMNALGWPERSHNVAYVEGKSEQTQNERTNERKGVEKGSSSIWTLSFSSLLSQLSLCCKGSCFTSRDPWVARGRPHRRSTRWHGKGGLPSCSFTWLWTWHIHCVNSERLLSLGGSFCKISCRSRAQNPQG
jgi:hypothetical protein